MRDRYLLERPFSELHVWLYPFETARIVIHGLITFPIFVVILAALVVSLVLFELSVWLQNDALAVPLTKVRALLQWILSGPIRIPSPNADIPDHGSAGSPPATLGNAAAGSAAVTTVAATPRYRRRDDISPRRTYIAVPSQSGQPEEVWYYINGVVEQGAMVSATTELFHEMTGRMCNKLENLSYGLGLDLLECVLGRTLDIASGPVLYSLRAVVEQLNKDRKVVLIAHSQVCFLHGSHASRAQRDWWRIRARVLTGIPANRNF